MYIKFIIIIIIIIIIINIMISFETYYYISLCYANVNLQKAFFVAFGQFTELYDYLLVRISTQNYKILGKQGHNSELSRGGVRGAADNASN